MLICTHVLCLNQTQHEQNNIHKPYQCLKVIHRWQVIPHIFCGQFLCCWTAEFVMDDYHVKMPINTCKERSNTSLVVVFPNWTLWEPSSVCSSTLTNALHMERCLCVCVCVCVFARMHTHICVCVWVCLFDPFSLAHHIRSNTPSSEFPPCLEGGCCYARCLPWQKIDPTRLCST